MMPLPEVKEPQGCEIESNEDLLQEIDNILNDTKSDNIDIGFWETYLESDYEIPDMFC
jgi:hypothetical protein